MDLNDDTESNGLKRLLSGTAARPRLFTLLVTILFFPGAAGPQSSDPLQGQSAQYHSDLRRYFANGAEEADGRRKVLASTAVYEQQSGWTAGVLASRLKQGERLLVETMRHVVYCRLKDSRNVKDTEAKACETEMNRSFDSLQTFIDSELQTKAIQTLSISDLDQHGLGRYRYLIAHAQALAPHTLSAEAEHIADLLADPLIDQLADQYDEAVRRLKAELIETRKGKFGPLKGQTNFTTDTDRATRHERFQSEVDAYSAQGDLFAAILIDIAKEKTALARLHNFPSAPAQIYTHRLQLTEPEVRATLAAMASHADVLKEYQRLRAEQVSRTTGIEDVRSWDMALSAGYDPKPMSFQEARTTLLNAITPLGQEYAAQFAWLLDPNNGALEIASGPNRRLGGFSLGYSGVPVTLYMQGFSGDFSTTSVVVHEGGHAIHRKLMSENNVSPFYATGPKFLTEAYAILNELLLLDEMERVSTSLVEKTYYQEKFLDKLEHEVFVSAEEGSFEQAVYDGVGAGNITGRKDLDKLNAQVLDKYELFAPEEPELRFGWMQKRLLFEDPLYLVNYLYAALVACKLYEMDRVNPKDFQVRYMALLREGFDAPGAELLQKNMGFALDRDHLLDGALHLMQDRTARLRQYYDQLTVR